MARFLARSISVGRMLSRGDDVTQESRGTILVFVGETQIHFNLLHEPRHNLNV
jgi:hypothetical protein